MAAHTDTRCLYSQIHNTSGKRLVCGFLPPHGRTLEADEIFSVFGNVLESLIRFERNEARRSIVAFEQALRRGDIEIVHTPNVIIQDQSTGDTKMLQSLGGTLGLVAPCWKGTWSLSAPLGDE
jgi:hypothetical protein